VQTVQAVHAVHPVSRYRGASAQRPARERWRPAGGRLSGRRRPQHGRWL